MPEQKSVRLAKYLSWLLPGLGSIYVGKYVKGMLWMLLGIPLLSLLLFDFILILKVTLIGGEKYFLPGFNPPSALIIILLGYLWCGRHSAKDAVNDTNDYNASREEFSKELNHHID